MPLDTTVFISFKKNMMTNMTIGSLDLGMGGKWKYISWIKIHKPDHIHDELKIFDNQSCVANYKSGTCEKTDYYLKISFIWHQCKRIQACPTRSFIYWECDTFHSFHSVVSIINSLIKWICFIYSSNIFMDV